MYYGIKGIFSHSYIGTAHKFLLFFDYIKCVILLVFVYVCKVKLKKTRIYSFGYTIHFGNYITFFYLFNEIFCKAVYPPLKIESYVDLGANMGMTILWYKYFNPDLKVLAFEPNPETHSYLSKNIKINKLKNITLHPVALSNKKGTALFYAIDDDIQNLDSGLTLNQDLPHRSFKVKTDLLSKYITEKVDLLKMDIEGGEYIVFEDLFKNKKIKYFKNIIFEAHFFNKEQKKMLRALIVKLKQTGKIKQLDNSVLTSIYTYKKNS